NNGVEIVKLDQSNGAFKQIDKVFVDRNTVQGMNTRATIARASMQGNGNHGRASGSSFPNHALRNVSENRVVIESDVAVPASVFVTVDQGMTS
ncbi:hypothetical protein CISIN_1g0456071mg, partial [Citrus sinensis]